MYLIIFLNKPSFISFIFNELLLYLVSKFYTLVNPIYFINNLENKAQNIEVINAISIIENFISLNPSYSIEYIIAKLIAPLIIPPYVYNIISLISILQKKFNINDIKLIANSLEKNIAIIVKIIKKNIFKVN